jgi:GMP synthase (glutamine-hydrolysing)
MKTLIVDNHTKHIQELKNSFEHATVISREEIKNFPVDDFDLIVLSGGSHVPTVLNHNEIYQEEERLLNLGKPVIGICLGCEIICKAFGGELEFMPEHQRGTKQFEIIDKILASKMGAHELTAFESHSLRIKKLPEDFYEMIRSEHGPEMIKHKTLPIIGVQFHPEVGATKKLWEWVLLHVS